MQLKEKAEFTNKHSDTVVITLWEDSSKSFQVITGITSTRKSEEPRFIAGELVQLPRTVFTDETEIVKTDSYSQALIEFNMRRAINGQPDYSMSEYVYWRKSTLEQKESN